MGKIFKSLGILTTGHVIETDRSGLVGQFLGSTAIKVNEVVDSALNGVLFIDEAYTLNLKGLGGGDAFGQEARDTLLKRMEDNRENLIVIVAGYTEEMNEFIEINPGFKSRFNRYLHFDDYLPEDLFEIFERLAAKNGFELANDLKIQLKLKFKDLYVHKDKSFGNARVVRNIFEKMVENQSNRLASQSENVSCIDLQTFREEDI